MQEMVHKRPDVTVLIAAYNCESFIGRAIASALEQQDVDLEVLVVDDCSTDKSVEVISALAAREPRLRLLRLATNGGPAVARNLGIEAATGRWVAVLDADDALCPGRLAHMVKTASSLNADLIADNWRYFDAATSEVSLTALDVQASPQLLDPVSYVTGARPYSQEPDLGLLKPLFRLEFLKSTGARYPPQVRHGEDFLFVFNLLCQGARFYLLRDLPGYLYTTRASGWSRTVINDAGLISSTADLLKLPEVRQSPELQSAIENRITALRRLELDRYAGLPPHLRPRGKMLRRGLSSLEGWKWLAKQVLGKLHI